MRYLVTLNPEAKEIEDLFNGDKSMIIFGSDNKCFPHGSINEGDILYFTCTGNLSGIRAKGIVSSVFNSLRLSEEESYELIIRNQDKLYLPDKLFYKYAGKRYLVLIGISYIEETQLYNEQAINLRDTVNCQLPRGFDDPSPLYLKIA